MGVHPPEPSDSAAQYPPFEAVVGLDTTWRPWVPDANTEAIRNNDFMVASSIVGDTQGRWTVNWGGSVDADATTFATMPQIRQPLLTLPGLENFSFQNSVLELLLFNRTAADLGDTSPTERGIVFGICRSNNNTGGQSVGARIVTGGGNVTSFRMRTAVNNMVTNNSDIPAVFVRLQLVNGNRVNCTFFTWQTSFVNEENAYISSDISWATNTANASLWVGGYNNNIMIDQTGDSHSAYLFYRALPIGEIPLFSGLDAQVDEALGL